MDRITTHGAGRARCIMDEDLSPLQVFISCFGISALAGFFTHLRSNKPINLRETIAVTFYSGMLGLVIGLLWYNYFAPANYYFLIGVSGLAGLGGITISHAIVRSLQRAILNFPSDSKDKFDE